MGTVVLITLLLITRFHVSKMDADTEERRRDRISRREKRWSMNSQRLEQIVAELMRPIGDLRRSFDTDLSALLEEYLTEAGLHALEAEGASPHSPQSPQSPRAGAGGAPNFPELALLLQQSANIYGRKVDFLYQHVLEVSESLQNSTNELSQSAAEGGSADATPGAGARRKRRASGGAGGAGAGAGWARVELLAGAAGARREAALRPPPTLPRMYVELEPRVLAPGDAPLADYAGEPVGLLRDFHVAWRLHAGLLRDELEAGAAAAPRALRAIPLSELQAAIEAAAPPEPPPDPDPDPFDDSGLHASTPLPAEEPEPPEPPPGEPGAAPADGETAPALRRKRKPDSELYERGAGKIYISAELAVYLSERREFSVCADWLQRVVAQRRAQVLAARRRVMLQPAIQEFRGFDEVDKFDLLDMGGFLGWSAATSPPSPERMSLLARLAGGDSDDDGFFEASDHGSEAERAEGRLAAGAAPPPPPPPPPPAPLGAPSWAAWRAGVVARAAAGSARGLDVRALGGAVLRALPGPPSAAPPATPPPAPAKHFDHVLREAATDDADVSRLFLATLFLANAGNVEIEAGPPLSLAGFSLRVVSRDEARYCAAAQEDPAFLDR